MREDGRGDKEYGDKEGDNEYYGQTLRQSAMISWPFWLSLSAFSSAARKLVNSRKWLRAVTSTDAFAPPAARP